MGSGLVCRPTPLWLGSLLLDVAYLYESLSEKHRVAQDSFGKWDLSGGLSAVTRKPVHQLARKAAALWALTAPSAAFVLIEANKENMFHVTKDTSGAGQGDEPQVLLPSPTTQVCFEEPQPSTSTSDLFPWVATSSMEPPAGQAPPSSSGELELHCLLFTNLDLCCHETDQRLRSSEVASGSQ